MRFLHFSRNKSSVPECSHEHSHGGNKWIENLLTVIAILSLFMVVAFAVMNSFASPFSPRSVFLVFGMDGLKNLHGLWTEFGCTQKERGNDVYKLPNLKELSLQCHLVQQMKVVKTRKFN